MSTPPTGHYRTILGQAFPMLRIAFTHTPIHGCTIVPSEPALKILNESKDEYAKFYSDGLRSGLLVTIVACIEIEKYYSPGELYFTS